MCSLAACAPSARPPALSALPLEARAEPARDTQHVTRTARSRQHQFERLRRFNLPGGFYSGSRKCVEVVGRFCLLEDDGQDWTPPPEKEAVQRGRERLLEELERTAAVAPRDPWVTGHRVRYLLEAGRRDEALAAARACQAEPDWWCWALEGMALHAAAAFPAADSAFARALGAMPESERCRWSDVSVLLEDARTRSAYRRSSCDQRRPLERRFWWLADPLFVVPGNDRRTEHYARLVLDALQRRAESGYGVVWGDDLRELLIRYGWPAGWQRKIPRTGMLEDDGVVSHDTPGGRALAPSGPALERPTGFGPADWPLDTAYARSTHLPPYADAMDVLEHQLAVFRRGDSSLIVAAYDGGDSLPAAAEVEAALVLVANEVTPPRVSPASSRGRHGAVTATVPARPALLSLELLAGRRVARARYGVPLAPLDSGTFAVSDLLLFEPEGSLPVSVEQAAERAAPSLRVAPSPIGVYWEVYGLDPDTDSLAVSVSVVREGKSWARKAFEWAGLARDRSRRAHLAWAEGVRAADGVLSRSLVLDLAGLKPGVYRLVLEARRGSGEVATTARTLIVPD